MKKNSTRATESEVRAAVKMFLAKGGIIRQLPEEKIPAELLVGWKHGIYEAIDNLGGRNE